MASFTNHFFRPQRHNLTSGRKLSRSFAYKMSRPPLDAENLAAVITEDIPVFTYKNDRFFLLLTIFGGMQFLCWVNVALFIKSDGTVESSQKRKLTLLKTDDSWMSRFYANNRAEIAAACLGFGKLFLGEIHTNFYLCMLFTARCYASAVLAIALCLSVTSRCSTKTAKGRITQTTPHDSPGTLVF